MSRIPALGTTVSTAGAPATPGEGSQGSGLDGVQIDDFLTLLITELQNQDPLDPLDNAQLLSQVSQIREIGSNDQLTRTLEMVRIGQNMSTASSLIGKKIRALDDNLQEIEGTVERVSVGAAEEGASIRLHVGDSEVALKNIREIVG